MAAFGNTYLGAYQPLWWTTTSTTTVPLYGSVVVGHPPAASRAPASAPVDESNVAWLRRRVREMCDLAEIQPAA